MKDVVCCVCGEDFDESELLEFERCGEQYWQENGCFFCPDCWDDFKRMSLEDQAAALLDESYTQERRLRSNEAVQRP